jgi:hypothetical protein
MAIQLLIPSLIIAASTILTALIAFIYRRRRNSKTADINSDIESGIASISSGDAITISTARTALSNDKLIKINPIQLTNPKIVITQAVNVNKSNNSNNSNSQTIIGKVLPQNGLGYSQLTASIRGSFNSNRSMNSNASLQTTQTSTTDYGVNINNTHPNIGNTTTNYNYTQNNHNHRSNSQNNKLKNKDNSSNGVHKVHSIINGNRIERIDSNNNNNYKNKIRISNSHKNISASGVHRVNSISPSTDETSSNLSETFSGISNSNNSVKSLPEFIPNYDSLNIRVETNRASLKLSNFTLPPLGTPNQSKLSINRIISTESDISSGSSIGVLR